ncbi:hypothetical protein EBGED10_59620 [Bacillus sp. GeD10]|nr:hypothetical protein EBGED10_59620 [Bacillus sp. GeD10]
MFNDKVHMKFTRISLCSFKMNKVKNKTLAKKWNWMNILL